MVVLFAVLGWLTSSIDITGTGAGGGAKFFDLLQHQDRVTRKVPKQISRKCFIVLIE